MSVAWTAETEPGNYSYMYHFFNDCRASPVYMARIPAGLCEKFSCVLMISLDAEETACGSKLLLSTSCVLYSLDSHGTVDLSLKQHCHVSGYYSSRAPQGCSRDFCDSMACLEIVKLISLFHQVSLAAFPYTSTLRQRLVECTDRNGWGSHRL